MGDTAVHPAEAAQAARRLGPAVTDASQSAEAIKSINDSQTDGKWGTESGPSSFRSNYTNVLNDAYDDVSKLQTELSDFVSSVKQVVENFSTTDSDSATAQSLLAAKADRVAAREQLTATIQKTLDSAGQLVSHLNPFNTTQSTNTTPSTPSTPTNQWQPKK
jgi:hypothetical protein